MEFVTLIGLSIGLGLLGFVEPCTIGSHLLFVKYLEGKASMEQMTQTVVFAVTRTLLIGALGAAAAFVGSTILDLQRSFWIVLGIGYVIFGFIYLLGKQDKLMVALGTQVQWGWTHQGAIALGFLFGLNIPACAAPLLAAVLSASLGVASMGRGFLTLALFGAALSLPLVVVIYWQRAKNWLERIVVFSKRMPLWTGMLFILLGLWSISFGVRA